MALLSINDLRHKLEATREILLSASDGDGIVSRDDFDRLNEQTEDQVERNFLRAFYHDFLLTFEDKSGVRVTEELIERGISFIEEQVFANLSIEANSTLETQDEISLKHDAAFQMAQELINFTSHQVILSPQEVSEKIGELSEGLFFDDMGSEAGIEISSFFLEHPEEQVSPESFISALGLDPTTPQAVVSRLSLFNSAEPILHNFIDRTGDNLIDQARELIELMEENLEDFKVIVLGEANLGAYDSEHPIYVFGSGKNGNLAGFESRVIWT
ncbi:MAG: nuclease A inhibitor family protein [Bacteroidota bacterium]